MLGAANGSALRTCWKVCRGFAPLLILGALAARGQSPIMSDDFETPGTAINSSLWPYNFGTQVEAAQTFFGGSNHYLNIHGPSVKALSADWSAALIGKG